ncbi:hypothetical protein CEXT_79161 [Caerostris extrusa]|uniref:Uncharacterized protein n=1 Tax=Caerostris extrusa TaxID=172846 RepID=A0AAV4NP12_CAEEX|nr:hypothetical protein CEXT_79161 [Caerostris extrusa]
MHMKNHCTYNRRAVPTLFCSPIKKSVFNREREKQWMTQPIIITIKWFTSTMRNKTRPFIYEKSALAAVIHKLQSEHCKASKILFGHRGASIVPRTSLAGAKILFGKRCSPPPCQAFGFVDVKGTAFD